MRAVGTGPAIVLATPSGERHEFGVLLVSLLMLDAGLTVFYLGADLPADQIVNAAERVRAAAVGIGVVNGANRSRAVAEVHALERALGASVELWVGGRDAAATIADVGTRRALVLDDLDRLERELTRFE